MAPLNELVPVLSTSPDIVQFLVFSMSQSLHLTHHETLDFFHLYDAQYKGHCDPAEFHAACDDKGPTLVVAEVREIKTGQRRVVAMYRTIPYGSDAGGKYKRDSSAFLALLVAPGQSSPVIYRVNNDSENAVFDYANYGPSFGGGPNLRLFGARVALRQKTTGSCASHDSFANMNEFICGSKSEWAIQSCAVVSVIVVDKQQMQQPQQQLELDPDEPVYSVPESTAQSNVASARPSQQKPTELTDDQSNLGDVVYSHGTTLIDHDIKLQSHQSIIDKHSKDISTLLQCDADHRQAIAQILSKQEETNKIIEGLLSRIASLEAALLEKHSGSTMPSVLPPRASITPPPPRTTATPPLLKSASASTTKTSEVARWTSSMVMAWFEEVGLPTVARNALEGSTGAELIMLSDPHQLASLGLNPIQANRLKSALATIGIVAKTTM